MAVCLCLCCLQTLFLNNSVVSHCSPQLFLPCDPPESKETTHPSTSVCAAAERDCVWSSILYSFLACCAILRELHCPALPAASFAKLVLFIVVPSWSQRWGSPGWTLWETAVWCAIRGLEPWRRGEVMHNSHGLNLLYFITLTVWVSPQHFFRSCEKSRREQNFSFLSIKKRDICLAMGRFSHGRRILLLLLVVLQHTNERSSSPFGSW